jgi:type IV/VI secretion system ImpK/VasF family protein
MTTTELATEPRGKHSSYYRSQLYTAYQGINPLVTAAHPLFSIIERVKLSGKKTDLTSFYANLEHEMKAFESKAQGSDYDEETIFISRYLISATLDEILIQRKQFQLFKQLMPVKKSKRTPDKQFFYILDKVIDKPNHYLDLLELIYFCLSIGFEGKYREKEHERLQEVTQLLYETITPLREKAKNKLFTPPPIDEERSSTRWQKLTISFFILSIIVAYFCSNYWLDHKAEQLVNQMTVEMDKMYYEG